MSKKFDLSHMPYIRDKNTFKAVTRNLMGQRVPIQLAIYKAAEYYGVKTYQVARYIGKLGSNTRDEYTGNDTCFDDEQWKKKKRSR